MEIQLKLSKDFERCLEDMKKKYGEDFELINGLHPSQLDFSEFIDNFVDKDTLADSSIDPNANANHKDIRSFMTEKGKSEDKLFGLNKIFMEIKKRWGLRTAKQWFEQEFSRGFYLNDSTTASYFPYCWANDFTRLATEGLFFLNDGRSKRYNNEGPKHLTTYFDDVIEFVSFLSNRQSGAVGMPNVIVWAWYFWQKDVENGYYMKNPDYYLRQQFQKAVTGGDGEESAEQGQHKPGKDALDEPVALPVPCPDFIDRDIAARLAESADGNDEKSYEYIHHLRLKVTSSS